MKKRRRWNLKNYYARKRASKMWTKPEQIMYQILKELEIPFDYQHQITCYDEEGRQWAFTTDFLIYPDIVIEVDGDRVHGTKRQMQKMRWRDNLLMKMGYKVYHFWASDILSDPKYIKNKIREILWFHLGI